MSDQQVPRLDEIISVGADALINARPTAAPFIRNGIYGHQLAGWRGQLTPVLARLADEVAQSRLPTATAQGLRDLASSEYDAIIVPDPQKAIGVVNLTRTGAKPGGTIPKGKKFRRPASATATPPTQESVYEAAEPVVVPNGATTATVRLIASQAGATANVPVLQNGTPPAFEIADTLFDPLWTVTTPIGEAAGGSTGQSDEDVRRIARALDTGRFAPTLGALLAGALSNAGVKHVAVVEDPYTGTAILYVADESWAYSTQLANTVAQSIVNEPWLGFGCRFQIRPVTNLLVNVSATVMLESPDLLTDPIDISDAIRSALQSYFDDRPDFYTFNLNAIGGVICSADRRILTCSSPVVSTPSGSFPSPGFIAGPVPPDGHYAIADFATHYMLTDSAVNLSYSVPS